MIVVDSSSIISLAVNCLCPVMDGMNVSFATTPKVYEEVISKPSTNKRFALEAMRIRRLFDSNSLQVLEPKGDLGQRILHAANKIYRIRGKEMTIIHPAESEAMALAAEIGAKAFLIDERTTRLLLEDPHALKDLLSYRNRGDVRIDEVSLKKLQDILPDIPVIRSAEIVAIGYEKGLLTGMHGVEDKSVLEAALDALKFAGCAISWEEIDDYLKAVI
jgi:predicted nucleic acid-binding protein